MQKQAIPFPIPAESDMNSTTFASVSRRENQAGSLQTGF